jgi:flavin-dependent dehydrogenase
MAIQAALPACPGLLRQEVVFCERLTDFYAWAIPKPDSVIVGAAFSDPRHTRPRFTELLTVICARYGIERRELRRCARVLSRPRRRADLCRGDDHTLLVGEAAGLVSPSSGEGISFALQSGMAAACALASLAPGRGYAAPFARLARRVSAKLLKARIIRTPFLRRLALQLPYYP